MSKTFAGLDGPIIRYFGDAFQAMESVQNTYILTVVLLVDVKTFVMYLQNSDLVPTTKRVVRKLVFLLYILNDVTE